MPFDYHLIRSRRRSLELRLYPDRRLEVRAPMRTRQTDIDDFVASRAQWIEKRLADMPPSPPPVRYIDGAEHLYRGESLPLRIRRARSTQVHFADDAIHLALPGADSEDRVATALDKAYREQAREQFEQLIERHFGWFAGRGHRRPTLRIKQMTTRWGSLSSRGYINLNLALIKVPPECAEYVVVHELCHLEHAHHGPSFHALMDKRLPDWRGRLNALNRAPVR
jgi:predicted metal-dependent hydrolase